jgi:hypothetical protein
MVRSRLRRGEAVGAARPASSTRVALTLTALAAVVACDAPTAPDIQNPRPEPPSAGAALLPALVPIPPDLEGCGSPVAYDTGDPAHPSALYQVCWPAAWNGGFIVYGHGYTFAGLPLAIPAEVETLAPFALSQGFAFAATSYRVNGLAVPEGVQDMMALAGIVRQEARDRLGVEDVPVLITGASEGGAVTTLAAEQHPGAFQGALSTCGPTGSFQRQIDYLGDFDVLFNYFFPDVFDGRVTPGGVDTAVMAGWFATYRPAAEAAVAANPTAAARLLSVGGVPVDASDPDGVWNAIDALLWYNVFATNDAISKLGGQPFDNSRRWYLGSGQDFRLNRRVQRFRADATARANVAAHYETSGDLAMPYVSLHTTGDPIVRFVQQPLYRLKALAAGAWREHSAFPVFRYGHCAFEEGDLSLGLALLLFKVGASSSSALVAALPTPSARSDFRRLSKELEATR